MLNRLVNIIFKIIPPQIKPLKGRNIRIELDIIAKSRINVQPENFAEDKQRRQLRYSPHRLITDNLRRIPVSDNLKSLR